MKTYFKLFKSQSNIENNSFYSLGNFKCIFTKRFQAEKFAFYAIKKWSTNASTNSSISCLGWFEKTNLQVVTCKFPKVYKCFKCYKCSYKCSVCLTVILTVILYLDSSFLGSLKRLVSFLLLKAYLFVLAFLSIILVFSLVFNRNTTVLAQQNVVLDQFFLSLLSQLQLITAEIYKLLVTIKFRLILNKWLGTYYSRF